MCGNLEDLLLVLGSTASLTGLLAAGQYTVDRVRRRLLGESASSTGLTDADTRAAHLCRLVHVVEPEPFGLRQGETASSLPASAHPPGVTKDATAAAGPSGEPSRPT